MGDFPNLLESDPQRGTLTPMAGTPWGDYLTASQITFNNTTLVWTANRAVYLPIMVPRPARIDTTGIRVVTQAGNVDVGIYDWAGTRLVSSGSVACAAAGVQVVNVADTNFGPGWYYLAFASDSATAIFRNAPTTISASRVCGLREQATAFPLPATATFASFNVSLAPLVVASYDYQAL